MPDSAPDAPPDLFLRTKIRVLRPPHGTIARPRLDAVRDRALQLPLLTLSAPGGFGKSTLAATWVAHWQAQGYHCTWLSLSQDEDEPARFVHALTQALHRLGQGVGVSALSLLHGRALTAPRAVLSLLLNDLEDFDGEAILVLDDWQTIHDEAIHDALAFFITHAPPQLHVVITSRITPALPLARLRAHGLWDDVDVAALRFDLDETTRLLQGGSSQPGHSSAQINALHASTEGWAAALRLAALGQHLHGTREPALAGSASVFATLFEDLLHSLPPDTVRFMAQTAVLERLTPALCDAVGERSDSALARMALANQRIEPARAAFAALLEQALRHNQQLRALEMGICLALAHMAAGAQDACFAQLADTLQAVQHSGAIRSVLDEGDEVQPLLARFRASRFCDAALGAFTQPLITPPAPAPGAHELLTERELQVLQLVAQGQSNKIIARAMGISAETVKTHLKNIFEKLGVQQRKQAAAVAQSLGLLA